MAKRARTPKSVETLTHGDATRKNIPTAEYQPVMREEEQTPIRVAYQRRNRDLDPQLVWRGSACRTSPCATSPTTRKSTSFGTNIKKRSNHFGNRSTRLSTRHGGNGKSHAKPTRRGQTRPRHCTANGGNSASPGKKRSTRLSRQRRTTSISTTSPTRTRKRCASPARSRSIAYPRTAFWASMKTTTSSTAQQCAATVNRRILPR